MGRKNKGSPKVSYKQHALHQPPVSPPSNAITALFPPSRSQTLSHQSLPFSQIVGSPKEYGMTLIELLLLLLLSAVLFFFAKQSYQSFQRIMHEELLLTNFRQHLKMAKRLASLEDRGVTLCGTQDGKSCVSPQEKRWSGWLLFYDDLATFSPAPERIIAIQHPPVLRQQGFYLQTTSNIGGGIHFRARREYAYGMARSLANGRIHLCAIVQSAAQGTMNYAFIINVYGYSRLTKEKGACP